MPWVEFNPLTSPADVAQQNLRYCPSSLVQLQQARYSLLAPCAAICCFTCLPLPWLPLQPIRSSQWCPQGISSVSSMPLIISVSELSYLWPWPPLDKATTRLVQPFSVPSILTGRSHTSLIRKFPTALCILFASSAIDCAAAEACSTNAAFCCVT